MPNESDPEMPPPVSRNELGDVVGDDVGCEAVGDCVGEPVGSELVGEADGDTV